MTGRKILVSQKNPDNITAYGISMPTGIESALHHAMEGTEIDLLYLWACYRLVHGVHSLALTSLNKDKTKALQNKGGSLSHALFKETAVV